VPLGSKDQTWTTEHGHFLAMGGYILIDSPTTNNPLKSRVLSYELFEELVHDPKIIFPPLSIEEIKDKSKGDFLTKSIAILQTTWFIVECIIRATQGLAVTELELATLALASLNAITYFFWWHKPLGVLEPARIYLDETLQSRTTFTESDDNVNSPYVRLFFSFTHIFIENNNLAARTFRNLLRPSRSFSSRDINQDERCSVRTSRIEESFG